eukprot:254299-Pyramimonas_sp.AAC.1
MRARGASADFCPAVQTGGRAPANSAGVLAGGLGHINQLTIQVQEISKLPKAFWGVLARHVQAA